MLTAEIQTLRLADHPNIVRLYEIFEDNKYIHLVTDLCSGSDLLEIFMSNGIFHEKDLSILLKKMLSAVNHLHSLNICHRDLKPDNFMLETHNLYSEVKLIDFGMAAKFSNEALTTILGSPFYIAPEVFEGKYGKECDV